MPTAGLHLDNKSWLARRDGYVRTLSGDEIPAGLDNIYLRSGARRLDDFELTTYASDASLRIQWSVGGGATLPTLSSAANALSGDASLEIVADAATSTVFREWARERFGYAWPGGSTPTFDTSTGTGAFRFGAIRGIRFRATHSGTGAATLFVMLRNSGGTISRRWNALIDGSGATLHFIDFTATPDAAVGVWDETVIDELVFGNLANTTTYRFDDIDFIVESNIQDILYEIWRLAGTGGGMPSSLQIRRASPETLEVSNAGTWALEFFDPAGAISIATADIIPGNYTIDRIRQGTITAIVASTLASEAAGTVFATYTPPLATWEPGDLIRVTFSGGSIRILPSVLLIANAAAAQNTVQVEDADQWDVGWEVTVFDDAAPNGEIRTIASIDDIHQITLAGAALANTYTTAANARLRRSASLDNIIFWTPVVRRDTGLELEEAWMISDYDAFDVVDATADTERWSSEYVSGTEGGTADINTTTAGQLRVRVDPDATPTAAEYAVRRLQTSNTRFFQTTVDMTATYGTLFATDSRAGMMVSRGIVFDTNNYVRVYKEDSTGIPNRVTAEANFGGAGAAETNVTLADDNLGLKIERIGNIWRCYYSLENYPDTNWILIREFEDTGGNMSEATSTYLTVFSGGTDDAQIMTADFDNWFYYINSAFLEQMYGVTVIGEGVFTTSSATVPADSSRTEGDDYWNGAILMPTAGVVAFQPRLIVDYTGATDTFSIDLEHPFTAATGLVPYVILAAQGDLVPAADSTRNFTVMDVVGQKVDTAQYSGTSTNSSLHRLLRAVHRGEILATGTLTTDSATVPADTGRTEVNNYWNGSWLMTVTGAVAFQPRLITGFANAGGVFTIDAQQPFTGVPGLSAYIILSPNSQLVPAVDAATNTTPSHVVGNKSDAAAVAAGTASIIARLRAIEAALSVNAAAGGEFELDGVPDLWDALVTDSSAQVDITTLTGNRDAAVIQRLAAIINAAQITDAGTTTGFEEDGTGGRLWESITAVKGTFTTSSATVPADTGRAEANDYFNGDIIIPISGAVIRQARVIVDFANAGGVFTIDPQQPFTAAPGTVDYIILHNDHTLVPGADATSNLTTEHVVGNKSDAAAVGAGTASLIARIRALEAGLSVNAAGGGEFELDGVPDLWDATVVDSSTQADIISLTGNRDGAIIERLSALINALNITNTGSGTGLTENGARNIVTALGTDGTNVTDSTTSVLGAVGANNANNAYDSTLVVSNRDGSTLERLEFLLAALGATFSTTTALGTTTTFIDTARTEANDYWNDRVYFVQITGTNAGLATKVVDFDNATNTGTLEPALPNAVASGVQYMLLAFPVDMIVGADNANNAAATTLVVENGDGSLVERLEEIRGSSSTATFTLTAAMGTAVQTVSDISPIRHGRIAVEFDLNTLVAAAEGGTVIVRLLNMIDGATLRIIDRAQFVVGADEVMPTVSGFVQEGTTTARITLQVNSAVSVNRDIPWRRVESS